MKYISLNSVLEAYKGFQNSMTNKSWGYLAILKCCKSYIRTSVPYEVDLDEVSNFLENIFNLSINKKKSITLTVPCMLFSLISGINILKNRGNLLQTSMT